VGVEGCLKQMMYFRQDMETPPTWPGVYKKARGATAHSWQEETLSISGSSILPLSL